jgi:glycosyltransferase involved in cell wall biosynthesis
MNHLVVVRMKYLDDEKFFKRDDVRSKTFIPSILNQINKNFKIGFIININHIQVIKDYFKNSQLNILFFDSSDDVRRYVIENDVKIQTRIDDDDIISCEYIDLLQKIYNYNILKYDSFLIQTQPFKLLLESGEYYRMGLRYTNTITSMFLTLCQKNVNNFIMDRPHNKMSEITEYVLSTNEGICDLVINNTNNVSDIKKYDKKIEVFDYTVIVPTYKNVEYIEECLSSIIKSSEGFNYEILVGIDNCEESLEYFTHNQNKFPGVKIYLFKEHVGPYVIKNTLSNISKSNNLIFFDSDDLMSPEMISTIMDLSNNYGSVRFKFRNFHQDTSISSSSDVHGEGVFFIKKSYFNFLNGFEPWKCAADSEFHLRCGVNNIPTKYINDELFYRRIHNISLTNNETTGRWSDTRKKYINIIQNKKKFNNLQPLPEMIVHSFYLVDGINPVIMSDYTNFKFFEELNNSNISNKPLDLKGNPVIKREKSIIPVNFNPERFRKNKNISIPEIKPPTIQNRPNDRNKLFDIKKNFFG